MAFKAHITEYAEADLPPLYKWIAHNDALASADQVMEHLEAACIQLETMPERGHVPVELERIQVMEYREVHWKPYRIIYQVTGMDVHILAIIDGRRDLEEFLMRRLLS